MSGLTTHVLDLASGLPAAGVGVRALRDPGPVVVAASVTDADGRARLIETRELAAGAYRLEFDVGAHFRARGLATDEPAFLETVIIAFNVEAGREKLHVPLLVSPFGYSTYRGS